MRCVPLGFPLHCDVGENMKSGLFASGLEQEAQAQQRAGGWSNGADFGLVAGKSAFIIGWWGRATGPSRVTDFGARPFRSGGPTIGRKWCASGLWRSWRSSLACA